MKEIRTLSITRTENEVLNELVNFCNDRPFCSDCPLIKVCSNYSKKSDDSDVIMGDFLTNILTNVKIEEEE